MSELENNVRKRETEDLQHAIKMNMLSDEALPIAKAVLTERGEAIPDAIPIEVLENEAKKERKKSNKTALSFFIVGALTLGYGISQIDLKHPEESQKRLFNIFLAGAASLGVGIFKRK